MKIKLLQLFLGFVLLQFFTQNLAAENLPLLAKKSSVVPPLNSNLRERLDIEIALLINQNSSETNQKFSIFALEPKLLLLEEGKIEGMQSRPTVKLDVVFGVVNLYSGESFGAFNLVVAGSGSSRDQACEKALATLRKQHSAFAKKLEAVEENIKNYYRDHCLQVVEEAKRFAAESKLDDALALLHGIPSNAPCFAEAQNLKLEIFQKIQQRDCQRFLHESDALSAANDFRAALRVLAQMDSTAPCFAEAKSRVAAIETKFDAEQRTQNEWLLKFFEAGADGEKARLFAISELCAKHLHARWELH